MASRLRLMILLLMIGSVGFLPYSSVFGQYVTITTTTWPVAIEQVWNGPLYLEGTEGGTQNCSVEFFPYIGVGLNAGETLTVEVTANNIVQMAIVTTYGSKIIRCDNFLRASYAGTMNEVEQLYIGGGKSFQFQWTATSAGLYFVALMNNGPNVARGSLVINRVFAIPKQWLYLCTQSPYTCSSVTSTQSLQMPQPPQPTSIQSPNNTAQLASALLVIAAVVLGAVFLYTRRRDQLNITKAEKVDSQTEKMKTSKNFCIGYLQVTLLARMSLMTKQVDDALS